MARARWDQTVTLIVAVHSNGVNRPIRDPERLNPYSDRAGQEAAVQSSPPMTLAELLPVFKKAWG